MSTGANDKPNAGSAGECTRYHREVAEETAALYALGALAEIEIREYEEHLDSGCEFCQAEIRGHDESLTDYAAATTADVPAPPADLKAKVLGQVTALAAESPESTRQVWKQWQEVAAERVGGLSIVRGSEEGWEPIDIDGIAVKRLNVDEERRTVTMLVRMDAGTAYPTHRHAGIEECFVLQGDLQVGGEVLRAGDYQCADSSSVHDVQSTENGCVLLITSSQDDELL